MVALEEGLRTEALQVLTFWEHIVQIFGTTTSGRSEGDSARAASSLGCGTLPGKLTHAVTSGRPAEGSNAYATLGTNESVDRNTLTSEGDTNEDGEMNEGATSATTYAPTGGFKRANGQNSASLTSGRPVDCPTSGRMGGSNPNGPSHESSDSGAHTADAHMCDI